MRRLILAILLALALTSCSSSTPVPGSAPTDVASEAQPDVLILGDSYTAGEGAENPTDGYAYRVGPALGWHVTVDGVGGTGYVNPNHAMGNYRTRLAASGYGDTFDIVLIEGGTNDQGASADGFSAAVDDTLAAFGQRFPSARIILLGLFSWEDAITPEKSAVNSALRAAADSHGLEFVDPLTGRWFTASDRATLINPANDHPNAAGYEVMAARLVDDLRAGAAPTFEPARRGR
ncbi:hypothetical protein B7R22_09885 [Subtercola boreus]|uniref:SGNH hydrolase-type esterase domain-containing protein n=1 Tax=Subtercola boreus TaxID=120213 RepID=A0A3E0VX63_9MICO|nr:SGNH/GDSL hydrolase family protein [Subtercola boreus]RFA13938.1 hypothetical protein B7R22_09885 [Subtercola boreus]